MRKEIIIFIFLLLAQNPFCSILTILASQNILVNGDFAESLCLVSFCTFNQTDAVKGWIPDPEIEIGYGFIYNQNFGYERVIELASSKNTCVKQIISNIAVGIYQLKFTYAARMNRDLNDSQFTVSFNDQVLTPSPITPANFSAKVVTFDVEFKSACQTELKFCGVGEDSNSYGVSIKSISLTPKTSSVQPLSIQCPVNLVLNGYFAQNNCQTNYCIFATNNSVKGWIPDPEIEIGWGSVYSLFLKSAERVVELSSNYNSCIRQVIPSLQAGFYQLRFDYLARNNIALTQCSFSVALNQKILKSITPTNYKINTQIINVDLKYGCDVQIRFCGTGLNNISYGAILKTVRLYKTVTSILPISVGCIPKCIGAWGNDTIINGGFQQTTLPIFDSSIYFYYIENYSPQKLPGWMPTSQIALVKNSSDTFSSNIVAGLDSFSEKCMVQNVTLGQTKNLLTFDWKSAGDPSLIPQFFVKVNDQVIKNYVPAQPTQFKLGETLEIPANQWPVASKLQFCIKDGQNPDSAAFVFFENIKLQNWSDCAYMG